MFAGPPQGSKIAVHSGHSRLKRCPACLGLAEEFQFFRFARHCAQSYCSIETDEGRLHTSPLDSPPTPVSNPDLDLSQYAPPAKIAYPRDAAESFGGEQFLFILRDSK